MEQYDQANSSDGSRKRKFNERDAFNKMFQDNGESVVCELESINDKTA